MESRAGRKRAAAAAAPDGPENVKNTRLDDAGAKGKTAAKGYAQPAAVPSPPGSLLRIKLENFMCHNNLQVDFGRHINFIVGENGSGKSAILTALLICFGETARQTNRGGSLKQLIKQGATYALVQVTLRNDGDEAFKPEVYGDSITIERRITPSSALFSVRDANDRIVSKGRGELNLILDHLSIDVTNPCTVMTQDLSRSFLHSGRDEDKYKFFMEATLLSKVRNELLTAEQTIDQMADGLAKLEEGLPAKEKELTQKKDTLLEAQEIENLRLREQHTLWKLAWHDVQLAESKLQEITEMLTEDECPAELEEAKLAEAASGTGTKMKKRVQMWGLAPRLLQKNAREIREEEERLLDVEQQRQELTEQAAQQSETLESLLETKREVEAKHSQAKRAVRKAQTDEMQANNEIKACMQEKAVLQESIAKIQEQAQTATQAVTNQHARDRRAAEEKLEEAHAAVRGVEAQMDQATQAVSQESRALREVENAEANVKQTVGELQSAKSMLQSQSNSSVAAFGGPNVQVLLNLLKDHARTFQTPPVGPLGTMLALKDPDWAIAVEACIGSALTAFIVSSAQDKNQLAKLCRQAGMQIPTIYIVSQFNAPRYQMRPDQLPPSELLSLLQVLDFKHDVVHNTIVDQVNVERIVLEKNAERALEVGCHRVPPNVKAVYDPKGTHYFKKGGTETVLQNRSNRPPRLGVDVHRELIQVEAKLAEADRELREILQRKRDAGTRLSEAKKALTALQAKRKQCKQTQARMESILEEVENEQKFTQAESSQDAGDVSTLLAEAQDLDERVALARTRLAAAQSEAAAAGEQRKELEVQVRQQQARQAAFQQELEGNTSKLQELGEQVRESRKKHAKLERTRGDLQAKQVDLQQQLANVTATYNEKRGLALQVCTLEELQEAGGMDMHEDGDGMAKLNRELERIQKFIRKEEQRILGGTTLEELQYAVKRAQRAYDKLARQVESAKLPVELLQQGLKERKKGLMDNAKMTSKDVSSRFAHYMGRRGHAGRIKVQHKEGKLEMEVVMSGSNNSKDCRVNNTKTLSGGERSYSTLAFTLALGACNEAPFRAMDEFDVYMDAVNRRVGTEHLINFAREHSNLQFVYLTPQDISMLDKEMLRDDGFVHVQKLQNAGR